VTQLREELARLDVADPRLVSFNGLPVMTHAFFPGGNGVYEGVDAVRRPVEGPLVLGSNFGCHSGFIDAQRQLLVLDERRNSAWAHQGDSNMGRNDLRLAQKPAADEGLCTFFRVHARAASA
jgi:hypothetical protein